MELKSSTPDPVLKLLEAKRLYEELLYAVGKKFPDETRHQTALRYIRQAEQHDSGAKAAKGEMRKEMEE